LRRAIRIEPQRAELHHDISASGAVVQTEIDSLDLPLRHFRSAAGAALIVGASAFYLGLHVPGKNLRRGAATSAISGYGCILQTGLLTSYLGQF